MPLNRPLLTRRNPRSWLLLNSLLAACVVLAAGVVSAAPPLSQSREKQLTSLVRQDCGSCHGMTLNGGLGKPLTPASLADLETDGIAYIILEGVPGQPMPPWKGLLTPDDARWIAARLKEGFPE